MGTILAWLLPTAISIVLRYGIPELEKRYPNLAPLLEEILKAVGGLTPRPAVHVAAETFKRECQGVACPTPLSKE